jgi:hypothetical protein
MMSVLHDHGARSRAVLALAGAAIVGQLLTGAAGAEDIVVSNYGVAANGMPFGVALEKGFSRRRAPMSLASSPRPAAERRCAIC